MVAHLVVTKSTGQQLFDTSLISYGLVKSGYMTYIQSWSRRTLKSIQLDPNDGGNWVESVTTTDGLACPLFGFTVTNCQSPIVFIVGSGCLQGTTRSGNTMTFLYSSADTNTRYYCFDLMADNISGSPLLKTYLASGAISFNSLQNPCNVLGAIQAPGVPAAVNGKYGNPYLNGYVVRRSLPLANGVATGLYAAKDAVVDVALSSGVEYAAFLPWSRFCGLDDAYSGATYSYGVSEGAYGRVGGVSFIFGASGATTQSTTGAGSDGNIYSSIPTTYPTALVVATAGLPFPLN
jgi:hypothetical protein